MVWSTGEERESRLGFTLIWLTLDEMKILQILISSPLCLVCAPPFYEMNAIPSSIPAFTPWYRFQMLETPSAIPSPPNLSSQSYPQKSFSIQSRHMNLLVLMPAIGPQILRLDRRGSGKGPAGTKKKPPGPFEELFRWSMK